MGMSQNVMYRLGEGDLIMFCEIPISTIKLPENKTNHPISSNFLRDDFKRSLTYPCQEIVNFRM